MLDKLKKLQESIEIELAEQDEEPIPEFANLSEDDTGIPNWTIRATSDIPGSRPHIRLINREHGVMQHSKYSVIYFDNIEADDVEDYSEASDEIKHRTMRFLRNVENREILIKFWKEGKNMDIREVADLFSDLNKF